PLRRPSRPGAGLEWSPPAGAGVWRVEARWATPAPAGGRARAGARAGWSAASHWRAHAVGEGGGAGQGVGWARSASGGAPGGRRGRVDGGRGRTGGARRRIAVVRHGREPTLARVRFTLSLVAGLAVAYVAALLLGEYAFDGLPVIGAGVVLGLFVSEATTSVARRRSWLLAGAGAVFTVGGLLGAAWI